MACKNGIVVINSPATIDEGYIGSIKIGLANLSSYDFILLDGERVAQAVLASKIQANIVEVEEIEKSTDRGECGFGSTGK